MASEETPSIITVWLRLMKIRVIVLLQITAICAILMHDMLARSGEIASVGRTWMETLETSLIVFVGGTLSAGGANAINMWYDRDIDPGMNRTAKRPIPAGHIGAMHALLFGIIISILGVGVLWQVHWKAGAWCLFSVLYYVFIYTIWLKRRTPQNIVVGGIAGATPPLIGWAAAASGVIESSNMFDLASPIPWLLFLIIFLWTPPHFWALALYRSGEYAKVGVPMMPNVKGANRTLFESKIYCILLMSLVAIPFIWPDYGLDWKAALLMGALGIWYSASVFAINPEEGIDENGRLPSAFHSFMLSLVYLAYMFVGLVAVVAPIVIGVSTAVIIIVMHIYFINKKKRAKTIPSDR
ncbi:MAG TPA: protoheme IX farnesyltransferase [Candidatus Poseidoniales archaeon]|jgi:protoheme IX farnesyltransferase|nr:MAG: protoheme IX farnesyltransferase [Euryarchaeota archaeon]HIG03784.1 protoheme IX farnesyltransferase [Candidatus Poseidoniales archaeon]HIK78719.1 protoheme IX farnesyltransferase [Candidatus Poseidoniales archaeon]